MAAALSYVLGWVTGLIFYNIEKDPFVRFHAMQSIIAFGALTALSILTGILIPAVSWRLWGLMSLINTLDLLASFVLGYS